VELSDIVIDFLKISYTNVELVENIYILYADTEKDIKYSIFTGDIAYSEGKLAWIQNFGRHQSQLIICANGVLFGRVLKQRVEYEECECLLLEWYEEYLILIYFENNHIHLCSTRDREFKEVIYHGDMIRRKDDFIYCREYKSNLIRRFILPKLDELNSVTLSECEKMGVAPLIIGYPNDLSTKADESDN